MTELVLLWILALWTLSLAAGCWFAYTFGYWRAIDWALQVAKREQAHHPAARTLR